MNLTSTPFPQNPGDTIMNTTTNVIENKPARLLSIDALSGFDMLIIAGGGAFIELLEGQTGMAWIDTISKQLKHPRWNGFTFYDFIFPLFLFISGVSIAFSIYKGLRSGLTKNQLYRKAFRRMIILIILGIIDKNTPITFFDPFHIRVGKCIRADWHRWFFCNCVVFKI
jgi:predicted acyltransferase